MTKFVGNEGDSINKKVLLSMRPYGYAIDQWMHICVPDGWSWSWVGGFPDGKIIFEMVK